MSHVLVIDDEPAICWGFRELLRDDGHTVTIASSAEEGLAAALNSPPDAALLDIRLPGMDGLTALRRLKQQTAEFPVIVMTAFGNLETAVQAVEAGAFDYLTKPFDLEEAAAVIRRALRNRTPAGSISESLDLSVSPEPLIGSTPVMQAIFRQIALVAASDVPVLITGESGTGRELVARAIHRHSSRAAAEFHVCCPAAVPPEEQVALLVGDGQHRITESLPPLPGLLARCAGGTLLIHGLQDLSIAAQIHLQRVLERREFGPPGEISVRPLTCRVLGSANAAVADLRDSGGVRADLLQQLGVVIIDLPPLRERSEDIPQLARFFLRRTTLGEQRELSSAALSELEGRWWPGNVRELRTTIEHAAAMSRESLIDVHHLPAVGSSGIPESATSPLQREIARWIAAELKQLDPETTEATLYETFIATAEPVLLTAVLNHCQGNRAAAARLLGLHRATLRQKLKQVDDAS